MGKTYQKERRSNDFQQVVHGERRRIKNQQQQQDAEALIFDMKRSNGNRFYIERLEDEDEYAS